MAAAALQRLVLRSRIQPEPTEPPKLRIQTQISRCNRFCSPVDAEMRKLPNACTGHLDGVEDVEETGIHRLHQQRNGFIMGAFHL